MKIIEVFRKMSYLLEELPLLNKATEYAFEIHKGQVRKNSGVPYFFHLVDVTGRVNNYIQFHNYCFHKERDEILAAAMLHDSIEDCKGVTYEKIKTIFNKTVANIVLECSRENDKNSRADKFKFLESFKNKSSSSILIKVADRYCNTMDYYKTPHKKKYASIYALQAYPIYQALYHVSSYYDHIFDIISELQSDISELQSIVSENFNFDIRRPNETDFVKSLVV